MKNNNSTAKCSLIVVAACAILTLGLFACNSSSSGGGGGPVAGGEAVTTEASIGEANVTDLAMGAFDASDMADTTVVMSGLSSAMMKSVSGSTSGLSARDLRRVACSVALDIQGLDFETLASPVGKTVYERTIDGPESGNATVSVNVNDETGDFSGSFVFNSFCDGYDTISGSVNFSGNLTLATKAINSINMSFNSITLVCEDCSGRMWGTVSMVVEGNVTTTTYNVSAVEDGTGYSEMLKDFVVVLTKVSESYSSILYSETVDGIYGDSTCGGYVDVSTEQAFMLYAWRNSYTNSYNFGYPYQGVLNMEGAGNTTARLTALSSSTYRIVADTNGDGTDDYDS